MSGGRAERYRSLLGLEGASEAEASGALAEWLRPVRVGLMVVEGLALALEEQEAHSALARRAADAEGQPLESDRPLASSSRVKALLAVDEEIDGLVKAWRKRLSRLATAYAKLHSQVLKRTRRAHDRVIPLLEPASAQPSVVRGLRGCSERLDEIEGEVSRIDREDFDQGRLQLAHDRASKLVEPARFSLAVDSDVPDQLTGVEQLIDVLEAAVGAGQRLLAPLRELPVVKAAVASAGVLDIAHRAALVEQLTMVEQKVVGEQSAGQDPSRYAGYETAVEAVRAQLDAWIREDEAARTGLAAALMRVKSRVGDVRALYPRQASALLGGLVDAQSAFDTPDYEACLSHLEGLEVLLEELQERMDQDRRRFREHGGEVADLQRRVRILEVPGREYPHALVSLESELEELAALAAVDGSMAVYADFARRLDGVAARVTADERFASTVSDPRFAEAKVAADAEVRRAQGRVQEAMEVLRAKLEHAEGLVGPFSVIERGDFRLTTVVGEWEGQRDRVWDLDALEGAKLAALGELALLLGESEDAHGERWPETRLAERRLSLEKAWAESAKAFREVALQFRRAGGERYLDAQGEDRTPERVYESALLQLQTSLSQRPVPNVMAAEAAIAGLGVQLHQLRDATRERERAVEEHKRRCLLLLEQCTRQLASLSARVAASQAHPCEGYVGASDSLAAFASQLGEQVEDYRCLLGSADFDEMGQLVESELGLQSLSEHLVRLLELSSEQLASDDTGLQAVVPQLDSIEGRIERLEGCRKQYPYFEPEAVEALEGELRLVLRSRDRLETVDLQVMEGKYYRLMARYVAYVDQALRVASLVPESEIRHEEVEDKLASVQAYRSLWSAYARSWREQSGLRDPARRLPLLEAVVARQRALLEAIAHDDLGRLAEWATQASREDEARDRLRKLVDAEVQRLKKLTMAPWYKKLKHLFTRERSLDLGGPATLVRLAEGLLEGGELDKARSYLEHAANQVDAITQVQRASDDEVPLGDLMSQAEAWQKSVLAYQQRLVAWRAYLRDTLADVLEPGELSALTLRCDSLGTLFVPGLFIALLDRLRCASSFDERVAAAEKGLAEVRRNKERMLAETGLYELTYCVLPDNPGLPEAALLYTALDRLERVFATARPTYGG